jgi:hypothetical protein
LKKLIFEYKLNYFFFFIFLLNNWISIKLEEFESSKRFFHKIWSDSGQENSHALHYLSGNNFSKSFVICIESGYGLVYVSFLHQFFHSLRCDRVLFGSNKKYNFIKTNARLKDIHERCLSLYKLDIRIEYNNIKFGLLWAKNLL